MEARARKRPRIQFGLFEVEPRAGELHRNGRKIKLQEQPFQILVLLLEHPGEVVTREELRQKLWPGDTFVDFDHCLKTAISKLRLALGDSPDDPRFIETLARHGYRFIASVDLGDGTSEGISSESPDLRLRHLKIALAGAALALIAGAILFRSSSFATRTSVPLTRTVPLTSFPGREIDPVFSPDGNSVAFGWNGENSENFDIYVKPIGGETLLRLTSNPAFDGYSAWSPDGQSIAFVRQISERENGIFLVPSRGGSERKLYSTAGHILLRLSWSSDGKYLAFPQQEPEKDYSQIVILSLESPTARKLTFPPVQQLGDQYPAFSPDGKTVAFIRTVGFADQHIYTVPLTNGGSEQLILGDSGWIYGLDWTPDASRIVFSSDRAGAPALWTIPASGGTPRRLPAEVGEAVSPSVSPRAQSLAFVRRDTDINIWRIAASSSGNQGSEPRKLIGSSRFDGEPDYSPDGKRIAFSSSRSGNLEIWVCERSEPRPTQLTFLGDARANAPRWSPDGKSIAFHTSGEDQGDIFVVSERGGPPRRVTSHLSIDLLPSWSKDSRWIYFSSRRTGSWQVWKVPAEGGVPVQVTWGGGFAPSESPNGKFLYYGKGLDARGLWRTPADGENEELVLRNMTPAWRSWVPLDDGILFLNSNKRAIEHFRLSTGELSHIATVKGEPLNPWLPSLAASPDGRWILYSQLDYVEEDIMMLENFR